MGSFNVTKVLRDFSILKTKVRGKNLVYLDNAATTLKPDCVINSLSNYYQKECSNIYRGTHFLSEVSSQKFERTRAKIKDFINASSTEQVIFTSSATNALNLVAYALAKNILKKNDEIIVSYMEHHSNLIPWQIVAKDLNLKLKALPLTKNYIVDIEYLNSLITSSTKIIAITYASNVLGSINPIEQIIDIAHKHSIFVVVDATQICAHRQIDVQNLDCDFLVFSAHKMYAPFGVGVLYAKKDLLQQLEPPFGGGGMNLDVSIEHFSCAKIPHKFEPGTLDIASVIAFYDAIEYLDALGLENIKLYENSLFLYAKEKLKSIEGIKIFCSPFDESIPIISFSIENAHPHDIATILDEQGIAVRAGHHCAKPLMDYLGVNALVRVSFAFYNTMDEIDYLIDAIKYCKKILL